MARVGWKIAPLDGRRRPIRRGPPPAPPPKTLRFASLRFSGNSMKSEAQRSEASYARAWPPFGGGSTVGVAGRSGTPSVRASRPFGNPGRSGLPTVREPRAFGNPDRSGPRTFGTPSVRESGSAANRPRRGRGGAATGSPRRSAVGKGGGGRHRTPARGPRRPVCGRFRLRMSRSRPRVRKSICGPLAQFWLESAFERSEWTQFDHCNLRAKIASWHPASGLSECSPRPARGAG